MQIEVNISAEAHRLRGVIARLGDEISSAERTTINADAVGKKIALDVLLGKATPADQEQHRRDVAAAREALDDRRAVRDAAREELRRLEQAENAEKKAAAAAEARKLIEQRIEAARKFDQAARMMQDSYEDFARLGRDIPSTGVELKIPSAGMAAWEAIRGDHRVDGALPSLVESIHPNVIRAKRIPSLASSEQALWRALIGE